MAFVTPRGLKLSDDATLLIKAPKTLSGCIVIPAGVIQIDPRAFFGCHSVTEIVIPDSVKRIGYEAFACCSSLKSVSIGKGVLGIGELAFSECKKLKSIYVPASVEYIGFGIAYKCAPELKFYCEAYAPHKRWTSKWNKLFASLENWAASTTYAVPYAWYENFISNNCGRH